MTTTTTRLGFLAALVAIVALAVSVFSFDPNTVRWILGIVLLVGSTTLPNYTWPPPVTGTSSTIPPTTSIMTAPTGKYCSVRGNFIWADTDTVMTLTHNFGLTTTQLVQGFPDVFYQAQAYTTASETSPPLITVTNSANNTVLTKISSAGTNGQWNFVIDLPHSLAL